MSTEQTAYPPCEFRLDGTPARCNHPTCMYCGCFVEPARCQACLSGPDPDVLAKLQGMRRVPTRRITASPDLAATGETPPDPPDPPGLVKRAYSYAEALARWTAAGRPVRPDKEVERIFNENCKTCKWFDPERQICRGCGCRVAESGVAVLNKIKMATENCPRKLW